MKKLGLLFAVLVMSFIFAISASANEGPENNKWISAWGTAPAEINLNSMSTIGIISGEVTARVVINPTASGEKIRIKLSNYYGNNPLVICGMTVAKCVTEKNGEVKSQIDINTLKALTFNDGEVGVSVEPGSEIYSDELIFDVKAHEPIAVTVNIEEYQDVNTVGLAGASTYFTRGEALRIKDFDLLPILIDEAEMLDIISRIFETFTGTDKINLKLAYNFIKFVPAITSLEVLADSSAYSVVVIGDSTVANDFPEYLAKAVFQQNNIENVGFIGKGLVGNSLLSEGLGLASFICGESMTTRFYRDVLNEAGVEYVIMKIGANDIIYPVSKDIISQYPGIKQPTSQQIIEGYRQIIKECHDAGIKIVIASITQWKDNTRDYFDTGSKYIRTEVQFRKDWQIAQEVNEWLASTDEHDGFVDLTTVSANPLDNDALLPEYTLDGMNPSDLCQRLWAHCFPKFLVGVGSKDDHSFTNYIYNDNATCTSNGTKTAKCDVCIAIHTVEVYGTMKPHTFSTYLSDGKATCTTDGLKIAKCDNCDATDSIPEKGGHSFRTDWTLDVEPTCTDLGSKSHHCNYCDEKADVTPIAKLGHTYTSYVTEPTCTAQGLKVNICSCGDSYTETLPAKGHTFSGSVCTDCGYDKADTCSCNCHKSGLSALLWKILSIFYKLLRLNKVCACGTAHF